MSRLSVPVLALIGAVLSGCGSSGQVFDRYADRSATAEPLQKSRAAIDQCREQRLKNEITTYKQSGDCSNPKVFAALRDARYPHMDLVTVWLNAREAALDNLDKGKITTVEFQRQMTELTNRLTAEERKRNAGLLNSQEIEGEPPAGDSQALGSYLTGLTALQAEEPQANLGDPVADRAKASYRTLRVNVSSKQAALAQPESRKPAAATSATPPASPSSVFDSRWGRSQ